MLNFENPRLDYFMDIVKLLISNRLKQNPEFHTPEDSDEDAKLRTGNTLNIQTNRHNFKRINTPLAGLQGTQ